MNIFISYSTKDMALIKEIETRLIPYGNIYYWDKDKQIGERDWDQIFNWICKSDIVLAIITENVVSRAMAVGNEIGFAKNQDKFIIPIITNNVSESELGCLKGITYERIDISNPWPVLEKIEATIRSKKEKEDFWRVIGIISLVLIVLIIWPRVSK